MEELKELLLGFEQRLNQRIDKMENEVNQRIDKLENEVNQRIDKLENEVNQRIDQVESEFYKKLMLLEKKLLDNQFLFEEEYGKKIDAIFDAVTMELDKNLEKSEKIRKLEKRTDRAEVTIFDHEKRISILERNP